MRQCLVRSKGTSAKCRSMSRGSNSTALLFLQATANLSHWIGTRDTFTPERSRSPMSPTLPARQSMKVIQLLVVQGRATGSRRLRDLLALTALPLHSPPIPAGSRLQLVEVEFS